MSGEMRFMIGEEKIFSLKFNKFLKVGAEWSLFLFNQDPAIDL